MAENFGKILKLKQGDTKNMMRCDWTAIVWEDKMATCTQICIIHEHSELPVGKMKMLRNLPQHETLTDKQGIWPHDKNLLY
jgi:hypothetical protein